MAPQQTIVSKIKVHLKLAISRLRIVQQRDTAIAKQQRRDLAQLLEIGKYESARIRVENVIRSDLTTELLEILELYCELLLARIGLLEAPQCDAGLEEAVTSIIYAAPRTEIKELQQTRQLLVEKFGRDFATAAMENRDGNIPDRVLKKLRVEPPSAELVESYLKAIASTYDIAYGDDDEDEEEDVEVVGEDDDDNDNDNGDGGDGGGIKVAEPPVTDPQDLSAKDLSKVTPPANIAARSPVQIAPPSPSTDNANPKLRVSDNLELKPNAKMKKANESTTAKTSASNKPTSNGTPSASSKSQSGVPNVEDLEKRFAALKRLEK